MAALSLIFFLGAAAQEIPTDPGRFTEYVAGRSRAEMETAPIAVKGPLTISIGGLQANLDQIFNFCATSRDGCSQEVAVYVKGAAQVYKDQVTPPARAAVLLVAVAIDALRALVRSVMSRAPHALSDILLRWTPAGWEIVG